MSNPLELNIALHPRQGTALMSDATEILYGGAAGGGKSYLLRVAALTWAVQVPRLHIYLFRRLLPDLVKTHLDGPKGFRALLSNWVQAKKAEITEEEVRFFNGSKIYLCHCKDAKDVFKYLSAEIHVLLIDELTTFEEDIYRFLRSRVRAVGLEIPDSIRVKFPRILCGSNPKGVGHSWVKAAFIDNHQAYDVWKTSDEEGGMLRQFIPAKLSDNPSMEADDPEYRKRLRGLRSPALVKAYEDGDWNIIAGAFFSDDFSTEIHVIEPFTIPMHFTRYSAFDWGSAEPFCSLWFAVSDGVDIDADGNHSIHEIPRGTLIVYREWYGSTGEPNKGLKMQNPDISRGILSRESFGERMTFRVADPSIFKSDGGPSIAETMRKHGVRFFRADNTRIAGWAQIRLRLRGDEKGPGIYIFNTCLNLIRTLPQLQHDDKHPEDVMAGEDHAPDTLRYGCMARPWYKTPKNKKRVVTIPPLTLNKLWKDRDSHERRNPF